MKCRMIAGMQRVFHHGDTENKEDADVKSFIFRSFRVLCVSVV
jgi:hypothetical protein